MLTMANSDLDKKIAHLENLIAELKGGSDDNLSKTLRAVNDKHSMTMKEIAELLHTSLQTAHDVANTLMRNRQAILVFEPWGRNKRLRLVSTHVVPVDSIFGSQRVGKG